MSDSTDTSVTDRNEENATENAITSAKKVVKSPKNQDASKSAASTKAKKNPDKQNKADQIMHLAGMEDAENLSAKERVDAVAQAIHALLEHLPQNSRIDAYVKAGQKQAKKYGLNCKLTDTVLAKQLKEMDAEIRSISRDLNSTILWRYSVKESAWKVIPSEEVDPMFTAKFDKYSIMGAEAPKISRVAKTVRNLAPAKPDRAEGLIAFKNGMYNPTTGKLLQHSPDYGVEAVIQCDYDPKAKEKPVYDSYIKSCSNEDTTRIDLLEALIYATVTGRYEMQTFWELIGKAGGGKSTFVKLLEAIVGEGQTAVLLLDQLDGKNKVRFATYPAVNKKLITYNETEKIAGGFETLKRMTGGDRMPVEDKHEKAFSHVFKAIHVVIANDPLISNETGSGVFRRRITIHFAKTTNQKEQDSKLTKKLIQELPAIINHLTETMTEERFKEIIQGAERGKDKLHAMARTDSIYGWAIEALEITKKADHHVGMGSKSSWKTDTPTGKLNRALKQLYPNYLVYCDARGVTGKSLNEFKESLTSLFTEKMGYTDKEVSHGRSQIGGDKIGYSGIRIRDDSEHIEELKDYIEMGTMRIDKAETASRNA